MDTSLLQREPPLRGIFTADKPAGDGTITPNEPIRDYSVYLEPGADADALAKGDRLVAEITRNKIADFEKNIAYCEKHGVDHPDCMVHVSTFKLLGDTVYMTYYANTANEREDPLFQEARLAFCPLDRPCDMTILTVQKAGETLDGRTIDRVYDTILLYKGGDELYLLWTASVDGLYYRLYCTYDTASNTLSAIRPNRFQVGDVVNDFSTTGIASALSRHHIAYKGMFSDIGIMQKLSARVENGVTYYYSGAYSGYLNCIIKSRDFVTWEYVSTPDFINLSMWENATYVLGDKVYYFVRQYDCMQGFLTVYDLATGTWEKPVLIRDAQSRSDFIYYRDRLFLMHAPIDREGFGVVEVDTRDIRNSKPVLVARMNSSLFYPFWDVYGDTAYLSYTIDRKHIRLTKFPLPEYVGD